MSKKKTKTLIGIVNNTVEEAFFLYFDGGDYQRIEWEDANTPEKAIEYSQRWGLILDRNRKINIALKKILNN